MKKSTIDNTKQLGDITAMVSPSIVDNDVNSLLKIIDQKSEVIEQQKKRIAALEEYLRLERARRFGASSEKYAGQQEMLFNDVKTEDDIAPAMCVFL